jgi:hypothetical protein
MFRRPNATMIRGATLFEAKFATQKSLAPLPSEEGQRWEALLQAESGA